MSYREITSNETTENGIAVQSSTEKTNHSHEDNMKMNTPIFEYQQGTIKQDFLMH